MSNKANTYKMFIPRHSLHLFAVILLLTLSAEANTKRFIIERQVARTNKIFLKNGALNSIVEIDSCLSIPRQDLYKAQDEKVLAPENLPSFPGGDYGFSRFIQSIMTYPYEARTNHTIINFEKWAMGHLSHSQEISIRKTSIMALLNRMTKTQI